MGAMAVSARVIRSGLRVNLSMESPGFGGGCFFRVAGIWVCSEISFSCWGVYLGISGPWVHIRCCGNGGLGFRPYGGSLLANAPKVTKNACSCVRPARWGSGFLRCGIDPGAASTVCFAAPPLAAFGFAKRSLRSHARINPCAQPSDVARGSRSKAFGELALGLLVEFHHCGSWLASDVGLTADRSLTE